MTSSASQVDETALSEKDNVATILHQETVDLRLDVLNTLGVLLQPSNVNLDIEVTNVCEELISCSW
jgi:hypothetical protein